MAYDPTVANKLRLDLLKLHVGDTFHVDATSAIATADATDLASASTLLTAIASSLATHVASACDATTGVGAHRSAASLTTDPSVSPLTKAEYLASEFEKHAQDPALHANPDRKNIKRYVRANGSVTELVAFVNDLKARINAHYAAALNSPVAT